MSLKDLTICIIHQIRAVAVQYSRVSCSQRCGVLARFDAKTTCFDTNHAYSLVANKWVEQANRIRAATDTRDQRIRQPAILLHALLFYFSADDALEIPDQHRIRVRAGNGADDVISV